jgi:hypothetical protein
MLKGLFDKTKKLTYSLWTRLNLTYFLAYENIMLSSFKTYYFVSILTLTMLTKIHFYPLRNNTIFLTKKQQYSSIQIVRVHQLKLYIFKFDNAASI